MQHDNLCPHLAQYKECICAGLAARESEIRADERSKALKRVIETIKYTRNVNPKYDMSAMLYAAILNAIHTPEANHE